MKKRITMMLLSFALLVSGLFLTGCPDNFTEMPVALRNSASDTLKTQPEEKIYWGGAIEEDL